VLYSTVIQFGVAILLCLCLSLAHVHTAHGNINIDLDCSACVPFQPKGNAFDPF
jgi:hypothetical protein